MEGWPSSPAPCLAAWRKPTQPCPYAPEPPGPGHQELPRTGWLHFSFSAAPRNLAQMLLGADNGAAAPWGQACGMEASCCHQSLRGTACSAQCAPGGLGGLGRDPVPQSPHIPSNRNAFPASKWPLGLPQPLLSLSILSALRSGKRESESSKSTKMFPYVSGCRLGDVFLLLALPFPRHQGDAEASRRSAVK